MGCTCCGFVQFCARRAKFVPAQRSVNGDAGDGAVAHAPVEVEAGGGGLQDAALDAKVAAGLIQAKRMTAFGVAPALVLGEGSDVVDADGIATGRRWRRWKRLRHPRNRYRRETAPDAGAVEDFAKPVDGARESTPHRRSRSRRARRGSRRDAPRFRTAVRGAARRVRRSCRASPPNGEAPGAQTLAALALSPRAQQVFANPIGPGESARPEMHRGKDYSPGEFDVGFDRGGKESRVEHLKGGAGRSQADPRNSRNSPAERLAAIMRKDSRRLTATLSNDTVTQYRADGRRAAARGETRHNGMD